MSAAHLWCPGHEISSPLTRVNDMALCVDNSAWLCPRLIYEGELNWFSLPTSTLDGADLHRTHDSLQFAVATANEVSAPGTVTVKVENVNDQPKIVLAGNVSFIFQEFKKVLSDVSIEDVDMGVGYYYLVIKLMAPLGFKVHGQLQQLEDRQPAPGNVNYDATKWQFNAEDIIPTGRLGYCPYICQVSWTSTKYCSSAACVPYPEGTNTYELGALCTPFTCARSINNLEYMANDFTPVEIEILILDFDDQVARLEMHLAV